MHELLGNELFHWGTDNFGTKWSDTNKDFINKKYDPNRGSAIVADLTEKWLIDDAKKKWEKSGQLAAMQKHYASMNTADKKRMESWHEEETGVYSKDKTAQFERLFPDMNPDLRNLLIEQHLVEEARSTQAGLFAAHQLRTPGTGVYQGQVGDNVEFKKLARDIPRRKTHAGGFVPQFAAGIDVAMKTEEQMGGDPAVGYHPSIGTHIFDKSTQMGPDGNSSLLKLKKDHPNMKQAMVDSRENQRNVKAQGFIPNFARNPDEGVVSRHLGVNKRDLNFIEDLRALPAFNENAWETFKLMTANYPVEDVVLKAGEDWNGINGPVTIHGQNTLRKRMEARMGKKVKGVTTNTDNKYNGTYWGDRDLMYLKKDVITAGNRKFSGSWDNKAQGTLRNEITHMIQDTVLQEEGTAASTHTTDIESRGTKVRSGFQDIEIEMIKRNIESLAWKYYSQHRSDADGGWRAVQTYIAREREYEEAEHKKPKMYGTGNMETLFKEIAAAHGDTWSQKGTSKDVFGITQGKLLKGGKTFKDLASYHKEKGGRPEWMTNSPIVKTRRIGTLARDTAREHTLRNYVETQSELVSYLSKHPGRGAPSPTLAEIFQDPLDKAHFDATGELAKENIPMPIKPSVNLPSQNIIDEWLEEDPTRAAPQPHPTTPAGGMREHKLKRGLKLPQPARMPFSSGFMPNFANQFRGVIGAAAGETFLPNLAPEVSPVDMGFLSADVWERLKKKGWTSNAQGVPRGPEGVADTGGWISPYAGLTAAERGDKEIVENADILADVVDSQPRRAGETDAQYASRKEQLGRQTQLVTNPLVQTKRLEGMMHQTFDNLIYAYPPHLRDQLRERFKQRMAEPLRIVGLPDAEMQARGTGAFYEPSNNYMAFSATDLEELKGANISPELRSKFAETWALQLQDEVMRKVGTKGVDSLRGQRTGAMKLEGFDSADPWSSGSMKYGVTDTGFSKGESELSRRNASDILWRAYEHAEKTAGSEAEFIQRIDQIVEGEEMWAGQRQSKGVGLVSGAGLAQTSDTAMGFTTSKWVKDGPRHQGYILNEYKSTIRDVVGDISEGHGRSRDYTEGLDRVKNILFTVQDTARTSHYDRLGREIKRRKEEVKNYNKGRIPVGDWGRWEQGPKPDVKKKFPEDNGDRLLLEEFEGMRKEGGAGWFRGPKFEMDIYEERRKFKSLREFYESKIPVGERVLQYQGRGKTWEGLEKFTGEDHAKPSSFLSWVKGDGAKGLKGFRKELRDKDYDAALENEYKGLRERTSGYRERVEDGGAPYDARELAEIKRFRELEAGRDAMRGRGPMVERLEETIRERAKAARKFGGEFPSSTEDRELMQQYALLREGNVKMNFRSGSRSVASMAGHAARWSPWEKGEDFEKRKAIQDQELALKDKYMSPDGRSSGIPYIHTAPDGMQKELFGHTAWVAHKAANSQLRAKEEWENSDTYKAIQKQKRVSERAQKIESVARANEALKTAGYTEEQIKTMGIGFGELGPSGPTTAGDIRALVGDAHFGNAADVEKEIKVAEGTKQEELERARHIHNVWKGIKEAREKLNIQRELLAWGPDGTLTPFGADRTPEDVARLAEMSDQLKQLDTVLATKKAEHTAAEGAAQAAGSRANVLRTESLPLAKAQDDLKREEGMRRVTEGLGLEFKDGAAGDVEKKELERFLVSGESLQQLRESSPLGSGLAAQLETKAKDKRTSAAAGRVQEAHDRTNEKFTELFLLREKIRNGGRLGGRHETEYDVVSREIKKIEQGRRDRIRVTSDDLIIKEALGQDGMFQRLVDAGISEEDAHGVLEGVNIDRFAEADLIRSTLMKHGTSPKHRWKDYEGVLQGENTRFGSLEADTEKHLRNKRKGMMFDAARADDWFKDAKGYRTKDPKTGKWTWVTADYHQMPLTDKNGNVRRHVSGAKKGEPVMVPDPSRPTSKLFPGGLDLQEGPTGEDVEFSTQSKLAEIYKSMDLKTRRRFKTSIESLQSQTIGEGVQAGTGVDGAVKIVL